MSQTKPLSTEQLCEQASYIRDLRPGSLWMMLNIFEHDPFHWWNLITSHLPLLQYSFNLSKRGMNDPLTHKQLFCELKPPRSLVNTEFRQALGRLQTIAQCICRNLDHTQTIISSAVPNVLSKSSQLPGQCQRQSQNASSLDQIRSVDTCVNTSRIDRSIKYDYIDKQYTQTDWKIFLKVQIQSKTLVALSEFQHLE